MGGGWVFDVYWIVLLCASREMGLGVVGKVERRAGYTRCGISTLWKAGGTRPTRLRLFLNRSSADQGIAGLEGFYLPTSPHPDTLKQYEKVQTISYRSEFRRTGNRGGHTDGTSPSFVRRYLAQALMGDDRRLLGDNPERRFRGKPPKRPTTSPADKDSDKNKVTG